MVPVNRLELGVVALIVGTLVFTGPVTGIVDVTARNPTTVGDGSAHATVEKLDTGALIIESGRFGTGVMYLRIPEASVSVSNVEGRPRIVYRIQVPALTIDVVATALLTDGEGTVRLSPRDHGIDPAAVTARTYEAVVTVRVQSFERDVTVARSNETVEVQR